MLAHTEIETFEDIARAMFEQIHDRCLDGSTLKIMTRTEGNSNDIAH